MSRQPDRPRPDGQKLPTSEQQLDLYAGPLEFIEPGTRGFLVTTLSKREESGIDEALTLLRQSAIQVYGGYKSSSRNFKSLERNGFVEVDCLDLESVKEWPHPGGEDTEELEKKEEAEGEKMQTDEKKEDCEKEKEEKADSEEAGKQNDPKESAEESKDSEEKAEDEKGKTEEAEKKEGEESKDESSEQKKKEQEQEKKEETKDSKKPRMHSIHKFKAYRTEMRNSMFIKSDVPDPMAVVEAAMELTIKRKSTIGDSVLQLLPVIGVCQYDYHQLEIMTRRTLGSILNDESGEPQSFAVMLIDKLSEPGSEIVFEVVRNTVWSVNPMAWMSSPISEPDFVLRFELIGSSLIFSCLRHYMRYRQYAVTALADFGEGQSEDDDGGWMSEEAKRIAEEKRKERERQREQERLREEERQKERARKMEEAEERRKKREEERIKRQAEKKEKESTSNKNDDKVEAKSEDEEGKSAEIDGPDEKEGTPPSKKQRKEADMEEEPEVKDELETSTSEEIPPSKKQRVNSGADSSKEEEEMVLGEELKEEQEVKVELETDEEEKKTPTKRTRRGTRSGKKEK